MLTEWFFLKVWFFVLIVLLVSIARVYRAYKDEVQVLDWVLLYPPVLLTPLFMSVAFGFWFVAWYVAMSALLLLYVGFTYLQYKLVM